MSSRRTLPFGEVRGGTGTWPARLDKGLVGGTLDNTGLTHVGAREYDPAIGRFISVDPIMDTADPQQWNGYAYANNSPVTFSDPTGMIASSCVDGGSCSAHHHNDGRTAPTSTVSVRAATEKTTPPASPWAEESNRIKNELAVQYKQANFDKMVSPDGLPSHMRNEALTILQEKLCFLYPKQCMDIAKEIAGSQVFIASSKGSTNSGYDAAVKVRSATEKVLNTNSMDDLLKTELSKPERDALTRKPGLARVFYGSAVHRATEKCSTKCSQENSSTRHPGVWTSGTDPVPMSSSPRTVRLMPM